MSGNNARIHNLVSWVSVVLIVAGGLVQEIDSASGASEANVIRPLKVTAPNSCTKRMQLHFGYYTLLTGCRAYQNRLKQTKRAPRAGENWKEPITGLEFVRVPEWCFGMGQTKAEKRYLIQEMGQEHYIKMVC